MEEIRRGLGSQYLADSVIRLEFPAFPGLHSQDYNLRKSTKYEAQKGICGVILGGLVVLFVLDIGDKEAF